MPGLRPPGTPPGPPMATSRSEDEESLGGTKRGPAPPPGTVPKRRSSSRFIKRKKFDDELVESSLAKSSSRAKGGPEPPPRPGPDPPPGDRRKVSRAVPPPAAPGPPPGLPKRLKKSKQSPAVPRDLGRWKPADDLLLINAVLQTNDLTSVHLGVKFSCRFTLREIQERWYALLYDPVICKLACQAMRSLHPEAVAAVQSKVLFSKAEEQLLTRVPSTPQPSLETFQDLLLRHPEVFYPSRTPKALQLHWQLLRQYHLLQDQTVQPLPKGDQVLNFSDAEEMVDDGKLRWGGLGRSGARADRGGSAAETGDPAAGAGAAQVAGAGGFHHRDELPGFRQPDPGSAAGADGAVPDALPRDHPGQGHQGQPDRRGPGTGGPGLEDLPQTRGDQAEEQRRLLHRQRGPAPHLHRRPPRPGGQQVEAQQQLCGRDRQPALRLPHQPGPHRPHQGRGGQAGPAVRGDWGPSLAWGA
ncbi:PREDICTED: microspherule protein 1 isoform X1 [Lepidothrix coronata]|uniref:Microspherule protein 1 isoform X1 n=1 Tax=Lepidothrix coronata TaxID=321398 RepID=A0A6J0J5E9_9PASS|nr:PREDICTED: microspherule protein 1 isoform X1 [Lepidothrix coronata]